MGAGLHLLVDGLTARRPDVEQVGRFIHDAVARAGLCIVMGPFFYKHESYQEAFAVIAESHVSVNWWPSGLILVDLFSCKVFDTDTVARFTVTTFGLEHWEHRVIQRMGVS